MSEKLRLFRKKFLTGVWFSVSIPDGCLAVESQISVTIAVREPQQINSAGLLKSGEFIWPPVRSGVGTGGVVSPSSSAERFFGAKEEAPIDLSLHCAIQVGE
jgi:hypothetical protein